MPSELKNPIENFIKYQYQPKVSSLQGKKNFYKTLLLLILLAFTCISMALSCTQGLLIETYYQLWIAHPVPFPLIRSQTGGSPRTWRDPPRRYRRSRPRPGLPPRSRRT